MLDTNIFNAVLDGRMTITSGVRLLATRVQMAELRATRDEVRRARLLAVFEEVNPEVLPTSSFAFGIEGAGWGEACWNDGSGRYGKMLNRLDEITKADKKHRDPLNPQREILIAETALKSRATLVSNDCNLRKVVSEFGGGAIDSQKFERLTIASDRSS